MSLIAASTVLLLRDGEGGLEVFMVKRHRKIDFAGGALVFPGGKVDDHDSAPELRGRCDGAEGYSQDELALRVAAIREVFEESGIFLGRSDESHEPLSRKACQALAPMRDLIHRDASQLLPMLQEHKLRLLCPSLQPFAHWITPKMSPKRFDTHFFLAQAPPDQEGEHDGHESVDSLWDTPQRLLQRSEEGEYTIIFPTRMNLLRLLPAKDVSEALAQAKGQPIVTVQPWVEQRQDGPPTLRIPADAGYPRTEEPLYRIMKEEGIAP